MDNKQNYQVPVMSVQYLCQEPIMTISGAPGGHAYDEGQFDDEGAWTDDD